MVAVLPRPLLLILAGGAVACGGGGSNTGGSGGAGGEGGSGAGAVVDPPATPALTGPADDAVDVPVEDTYLNWEDAGGAETYDIYLGTEADPPLLASGLIVSNHPAGELVPFTTYHWRVVAANEGGRTEGPIWSFTTGPTIRPIASFTTSTVAGDAPLTVQFTDTSQGEVQAWVWDLDGDGDVDSNAQNPTFTYVRPGRYDVRLTAIGADDTDVVEAPGLISVFLTPCDVWIDGAATSSTEDGSQESPYHTITAALVARPDPGLIFQVMPSRYDTASGETFPLNLGESQQLIGDVANRGMGVNAVEVIDDTGGAPMSATGVIAAGDGAVVAGLYLSASDTATNHYGVALVPGAADATIRDNTFDAPLYGGVYVDSASANRIIDNDFGCAMVGVVVAGGPVEIERNRFDNPGGLDLGGVNCGYGVGVVTPRLRDNHFVGTSGVVVPVVDDLYDVDAAPDLGVTGDPGGNDFTGVATGGLSHGSKAVIQAVGNLWPSGAPVLGRDILVLDGGQVVWGGAGQTYPESSSLVAHLGFYYGSAADLSGNGYNGANFGATPVADRRGNAEYAMAFNLEAGHTEDYVSLLGSGDVSPTALTVVAIVTYPEIVAGDPETNTIIAKAGAGEGFGTFSLFTDDDGSAAGLFFGGEGNASLLGAATPGLTRSPDVWYHVAVTVAPDPESPGDGLRRDYLAGEEISGGALEVSGPLPATTAPITLGRRDDDGAPDYFEGIIDDLRLYDRALSADEVRRLYVDYGR